MNRRKQLTEWEMEFIQSRDHFYMATVSETGWPYVQHRGGPVGFLRIIDEYTIGFADFRGNLQYLSVGNLKVNDKVALILMDLANRQRLKIWGRARMVLESEDPALIEKLKVSDYHAHVERVFIIQIEAFDWNCSQHIIPRFTETEIDELIKPLQDELDDLRQEKSELRSSLVHEHLGHGPLKLIITGIRQLTSRVRAYELRSANRQDLPLIKAGAHIALPVRFPDGREETRRYSIASNPARRDIYEVAVQREENGAGGSRTIHDTYRLGMVLYCAEPVNNFQLDKGDGPAILIAGGIGITSLKPMAQALKLQGRPFQLHYVARDLDHMSYRDRLEREFQAELSLYISGRREVGGLDVGRVIQDAPHDAHFYVCGPGELISEVKTMAQAYGIDADHVHKEYFTLAPQESAEAFQVELRRSGRTIEVPENSTVLDALHQAGVNIPNDCRMGICGTCTVSVLEGEPDHRDQVLTSEERNRGRLMCVCVSRSRSSKLVLNI